MLYIQYVSRQDWCNIFCLFVSRVGYVVKGLLLCVCVVDDNTRTSPSTDRGWETLRQAVWGTSHKCGDFESRVRLSTFFMMQVVCQFVCASQVLLRSVGAYLTLHLPSNQSHMDVPLPHGFVLPFACLLKLRQIQSNLFEWLRPVYANQKF